MRFLRTHIALVMLAVWMLPAQARVEPTHGFDLFSPQEEIQAGRQGAAQVMRQLPVLPEDDPVTKYVQRLGARLAEHAPGEKWPYTFHVVNQKEINAFALPGGPIFVNLGTIQAAGNEAQLAGVLAHEISHVVQRHGTRAASKQMAANIPLALIGGMIGNTALSRAAQLGISFGAGSYLLKNSRQSESEADLLGTDIMYDAGYDPHQMAVFFAKLEEQSGQQGAVAQFLSDHPDPGNRAGAVSQEVATLPTKKYRASSEEFAAIKKQVGGLQPMDADQLAAWQKEHGTLPAADDAAASVLTLDRDGYQISYPANWQVTGDADSTVTIAPQNGVTKAGIVYGATINVYQPGDKSAAFNDAMHALVTSLQRSNPGMHAIGNAEDIRINGISGKSLDLIGPSPEPAPNGEAQRERDWLVAMPRSFTTESAVDSSANSAANSNDNSLLYVIFVAPENDFEELRPVFEQMLKSLKRK